MSDDETITVELTLAQARSLTGRQDDADAEFLGRLKIAFALENHAKQQKEGGDGLG